MGRNSIWRLLHHPPQPPEINMAIDEAISIAFAKGEVPPTLRFYRWSVPSFSIGSFQKVEPDWIPFLKVDSIPLVRRMTGGRALLHDRDLTYAVIASTRDPLFSEGIKGTFYNIAKGLLMGLKGLGVDAEIYDPPRHLRLQRSQSPLCFASTSWYEITARGKKLIGSAQKRWVSTFLQHGSLILEKASIQSPFPLSISENQIGLSELLQVPPKEEDLKETMKKGFETALSIQLEMKPLTDEEEKTVDLLAKEKYGSDAWNFYREAPSKM